jgi:hypothetical protein
MRIKRHALSSPVRLLASLVLAVLLQLNTGCGPQRAAPGSAASLTQAYRLIDQNRADEAIVLLEKLQADGKHDAETTLALASA